MLNVAVTDISAQERIRLSERILTFVAERSLASEAALAVGVKSFAPHELSLCASLDVLVVGDSLLRSNPALLEERRRALPEAYFVLYSGGIDLTRAEEAARLGFDDLMADNTTPEQFVAKLVLLKRRLSKRSNGLIIAVDSGKGGVGVTSIVAGLGDLCAELFGAAILVDLDAASQDLTRFVQARPFLNEPLQLLLEQARPITAENLSECLTPIGSRGSIYCCAPPPEGALLQSSAGRMRTLQRVLDGLGRLHPVVLVDLAGLNGDAARAVYSLADRLLMLTGDDLASFHATARRLAAMRCSLKADAGLIVVENSRGGGRLEVSKSELAALAGVPKELWLDLSIPCAKRGRDWVASGRSLYSLGDRRFRASFQSLCASLDLGARPHRRRLNALAGMKRLLARLRSSKRELPGSGAPVLLPLEAGTELN